MRMHVERMRVIFTKNLATQKWHFTFIGGLSGQGPDWRSDEGYDTNTEAMKAAWDAAMAPLTIAAQREAAYRREDPR